VIRTPPRALPRISTTSPGFAAVLSGLLPGLGQLYQERWRRGLVLVALAPLGLAALGALALALEPLAAAMVRRAALLALVVIGGIFAFHATVVLDAFAHPRGARGLLGRAPRSYATLVAVLFGLGVLYGFAYRHSEAWAGLVTSLFADPEGRTVGAGTSAAGASAPGWSGRDRLNVLLLGVDTREDALTNNSDTVILLSLDPVAHTGVMLSIPRDTLVEIPGIGQEKVNAAYALGGSGGAELARRTVERFLGIPIHTYAVIDFAAFRETIDAVGGVLLDVPRPLRDEEFPTADYGVERITFLAGPQLLDGEEALRYARSRHDSNDFSRARRQQAVIKALRTRLAQGGVFRLPAVVQRVGPLVRTSFDPASVLPLARTALSVDESQLRSDLLLPCDVDVPHCELEEVSSASGYYLVPDVDKVRALVADLLAGRAPASAR